MGPAAGGHAAASSLGEGEADPLAAFFAPRCLDTTHDHRADQFLFTQAATVETLEPWAVGLHTLRFDANSMTQSEADALYALLRERFAQSHPAVLLAKQPKTYPLFFDVDIYGPATATDIGGTLEALELEKHTFFRHVAAAVTEVFPLPAHHRMAVFASHGISRLLVDGYAHREAPRASFHIVFPDVVVERPENCADFPPPGPPVTVPMASHCAVYDHVREYFAAKEEEGDVEVVRLSRKLRALTNFTQYENGTFHNGWCEVFDDFPLWHEEYDALSGIRLCWTKKNGEREARVKEPWKCFRWSSGGDAATLVLEEEEVPQLTWGRWGNMLDPSMKNRPATPLDEDGLRKTPDYIEQICACRVCDRDVKYLPRHVEGWEESTNGRRDEAPEGAWQKFRDPASGQYWLWCEKTAEGFWANRPEDFGWQRRLHVRCGLVFWQKGQRFFWDP